MDEERFQIEIGAEDQARLLLIAEHEGNDLSANDRGLLLRLAQADPAPKLLIRVPAQEVLALGGEDTQAEKLAHLAQLSRDPNSLDRDALLRNEQSDSGSKPGEDTQARCESYEAALREIAGVWPGEIGTEPQEDWRKARARQAVTRHNRATPDPPSPDTARCECGHRYEQHAESIAGANCHVCDCARYTAPSPSPEGERFTLVRPGAPKPPIHHQRYWRETEPVGIETLRERGWEVADFVLAAALEREQEDRLAAESECAYWKSRAEEK